MIFSASPLTQAGKEECIVCGVILDAYMTFNNDENQKSEKEMSCDHDSVFFSLLVALGPTFGKRTAKTNPFWVCFKKNGRHFAKVLRLPYRLIDIVAVCMLTCTVQLPTRMNGTSTNYASESFTYLFENHLD